MFLKIINHTWLKFSRSELFSKSLVVLFLLSIVFLFTISLLSRAGRLLPGILQEHFSSRAPAEWVYGLLLPIMVLDLLVRMISQSLPARDVTPYLHLPISRNIISIYWMIRSWISPFNISLLFFFLSFIRMTINPETGSHSMGLWGIFLLSALNQSLLMWIRMPGIKKSSQYITATVLIVFPTLVILWLPDYLINISVQLFLAFTRGDSGAFLLVLLPALAIHAGVFLQLRKNTYALDESEHKVKKLMGTGVLERAISSSKKYGTYWLLEYRLATRNKRSRFNFWSMLPISLLFTAYMILSNTENYGPFIGVIMIVAGGYGFLHLQHAFAWESHFFDFIATRNLDMQQFIRAKYNFYLLYNTLQFIIIMIVLSFYRPEFVVFFSGLYLYSCGFGYFFFMITGLSNSTRFDANKLGSFNMEGVSGLKFLQGLFLFLSIIPFVVAGSYLPIPNGDGVLLGVAGVGFIITQKWWSKSLVQKFQKRKYMNLDLYRKK